MTTNNFYAMRGERQLIATTKKIATAMHRLLLLMDSAFMAVCPFPTGPPWDFSSARTRHNQ